jgi:hypothetical protein
MHILPPLVGLKLRDLVWHSSKFLSLLAQPHKQQRTYLMDNNQVGFEQTAIW